MKHSLHFVGKFGCVSAFNSLPLHNHDKTDVSWMMDVHNFYLKAFLKDSSGPCCSRVLGGNAKHFSNKFQFIPIIGALLV